MIETVRSNSPHTSEASEIFHSSWAALARKHPAYLGEYCLDLLPSSFHRSWHDFFLANNRAVLWAPIDHGKSTQLTVAGALHKLGTNQDARGLICSYTHKQAGKWLRQIKTNIEHNPRLEAVFPKLKREKRSGWQQLWHEDAIIIERTDAAAFTEKDFSLEATGVGGAILGARYDFVILDDVLGPMNTTTHTMRRNTIDWFLATVIGRVVKGGTIWMLGTAWHEDDLAHFLARERSTVYASKRLRASDGDCRWPERFGDYDQYLADQKEELGEVEFDRQYNNEPLGESTEFFNVTKAKECRDLCEDPPTYWYGLQKVERKNFFSIPAGVDLGFSDTTRSALSSIFVAGQHREDRKKHLIHLRTGRWVGVPLLEQVIDIYKLFGVTSFLFETNAGAHHVAKMLRDVRILEALGLSKEDVKGLRVFGQFTTQQNRNHIKWGIRSLAPEIEALEWVFPPKRKEVDELFRDMKKYTPWDHPGDRLVSGWLASVRMRGRGTELHLRSRQIGGRG